MRQFLAIDLQQGPRDRLMECVAGWRARHRDWRWLRPETLHVTLRFLGDVSSTTDALARPVWRSIVRAVPTFTVRAAGLAVFPSARRPRLLVVPVWCPPAPRVEALAELTKALERGACEVGFAAQARDLRPHLTLARARRGTRPTVPRAAEPIDESFPVTAVSLMRSDLTPTGARYTVLEAIPLCGKPEERH